MKKLPILLVLLLFIPMQVTAFSLLGEPAPHRNRSVIHEKQSEDAYKRYIGSLPKPCELWGNAPDWYVTELDSYGFHCDAKRLLNKVAFKESTWRKNVCDYKWGIHCGTYQIGPAARTDCINTGNNLSDHHCALYHLQVDAVRRFESIENNYSFFKDVL